MQWENSNCWTHCWSFKHSTIIIKTKQNRNVNSGKNSRFGVPSTHTCYTYNWEQEGWLCPIPDLVYILRSPVRVPDISSE